MPPSIKKSSEAKLEILRSIINRRPFGYTLMEIYQKFKTEHGIGSRNTLKKYLEKLTDQGDINSTIIGNYRIFRSKEPFSIKFLFKQYPHLEEFSINLFSALTNVLADDLEQKGKLIGIEMAKSNPLLESKVLKQFQKFKDFFKVIPFQKFVETLREKTAFEFESDVDISVSEKQAVLTFKDKKLLERGGWIFYYLLTGIIETYLNDIFNQNVTAKVHAINEKECIILVDKVDI